MLAEGAGTFAFACQEGRANTVAHSAAGRTLATCLLVPHHLGGDGAAAADKRGSATGKDVRAGGREVDVIAR